MLKLSQDEYPAQLILMGDISKTYIPRFIDKLYLDLLFYAKYQRD